MMQAVLPIRADDLRLIAILDGGQPAFCAGEMPPAARDVLEATALLYDDVGFVPPWIGYLVLLVLLLIVAAAVLRRRGGKLVSSVVQVLVIAAGAVSWPMYVVGAAFAGIWVYWLRLWRR